MRAPNAISYGVAAEQVYMRMFPEHVHPVVMDHGTALDLPFDYVKPRASQYALDQVLALVCEHLRQVNASLNSETIQPFIE